MINLSIQTKANAIVDYICGSFWKVIVWDADRDDIIRTYTIEAVDDNLAAQEGLRRFVAEVAKD